jgi:hypothetical protein
MRPRIAESINNQAAADRNLRCVAARPQARRASDYQRNRTTGLELTAQASAGGAELLRPWRHSISGGCLIQASLSVVSTCGVHELASLIDAIERIMGRSICPPQKVGETICTARERVSLSQVQLARLIRVSAIYNWEGGHTVIRNGKAPDLTAAPRPPTQRVQSVWRGSVSARLRGGALWH